MIRINSLYTMSHLCPCCRGDIAGTQLHGLDLCPKCEGIIDATAAARSAFKLQLILAVFLVMSGVFISFIGLGLLATVVAIILAILLFFTTSFTEMFARKIPPIAITSEHQAVHNEEHQAVHNERIADLILPVSMRTKLRKRLEASRCALSASNKIN